MLSMVLVKHRLENPVEISTNSTPQVVASLDTMLSKLVVGHILYIVIWNWNAVERKVG